MVRSVQVRRLPAFLVALDRPEDGLYYFEPVLRAGHCGGRYGQFG